MIIDGDPAEIRDVLGQLYCNEGERFSKSRVAETTRKFHSTVYTPSNSFALNVETAKRNANEMFEAHRRNGSTCPTTEKDVVEKIIMEMGGHYSEARTDINMGNTPRDPTNLAKRLEEPTTYGGLINFMIAWAVAKGLSKDLVLGITQRDGVKTKDPPASPSMIMSMMEKGINEDLGKSLLEKLTPEEVESIQALIPYLRRRRGPLLRRTIAIVARGMFILVQKERTGRTKLSRTTCAEPNTLTNASLGRSAVSSTSRTQPRRGGGGART